MSDVNNLSSASTIKNISLAEKLIKGLDIIPESWSLTPVDGNKISYRSRWQTESLTREELKSILNKDSRTKGYGLKTGEASDGIIALDADGESAQKVLKLLADGNLPETVSFTSGHPGKSQRLYKISSEYWYFIKTSKIKSGEKYTDSSGEIKESVLELRWNGLQSVLPPSDHPFTDGYKWINSPETHEIAELPIEILNYFTKAGDRNKKTLADEDAIANGATRLYAALDPANKKRIDKGVNSGSRNNEAFALACDLIEVEKYYIKKDYSYTPDPRVLFDAYCNRCNPTFDLDEADKVWESANKSSTRTGLDTDKIENCRNADIYGRIIEKSGNSKKSQKAKLDNSSNPTENSKFYLDMAKRLLEEGSPESEVRALMGSQYHTFLALKKEYDQQFERESVLTGLPTLLKAQDARLSAKTVLYGDKGVLADILTTMAGRMGAPVEFLLTTFLAVAGSRVGTSSTLMIDPSTNRKASSIFWTCVVADTGKKKTPAQGVIIDPLAMLESESFLAHKEAIVQHKLDLQKYKFKLKQSGGDTIMVNDKGGVEETSEPEPPKRRRYIVTNITNETKLRIHSENPRGLLHHKDEWIGFTDAQNKYRGGKGDDSSSDLSEFNGSYITKDVMDDERAIFIKQTSISKTGNTQFDVLKRLQSKEGFEDFSGSLARWLFCLIPARKAYADLFSRDDGSNLILQETLRELYIKLGNLPDCQYKLSDDAKRAYEPIERMLVDAADEESHPGLKATYPKLITYLERFALLLHVVNNVLAGKPPGEFVSGFTMQQACKMAEFYLAQARILYALNGEENSVSGELLKIKDAIAKYPEGISIRDLRQKVRAMRNLSTETVKNGCEALIEANAVESADGKYFVVS